MGIPKGKVLIDVNDIVGKRLGKLTVDFYVGRWYEMTNGGPRLRHSYLCVCDCGNVKEIRRSPLRNEIVHSCGCLKRKKKE